MSTVALAAPLGLPGPTRRQGGPGDWSPGRQGGPGDWSPGIKKPAGRVTAALADTMDVAGRNLRTLVRTPQALVFATIQPMIFVLLFRYAFGGAIRVPGVNYVDYLMPGVFAQSVAFGAIGTAVGLSADLRSGILVRFRTLPMARVAVLGGRTLADLVRNLAVVAVMIGVGFAVGFRTASGAAGLLAALALVVAFAYAASWAFTALGLRVSDPEAAQAAAVPVVFLLVFTSSAFVPLRSMPGWLQAVGAHQPVNALVTAERALVLGGPAAGDVLISLAWSAGILIVFGLLAARTYARMGR
jgi:ABC-2 type transport system permease protein